MNEGHELKDFQTFSPTYTCTEKGFIYLTFIFENWKTVIGKNMSLRLGVKYAFFVRYKSNHNPLL